MGLPPASVHTIATSAGQAKLRMPIKLLKVPLLKL
jgi:hypothetical protein